MEYIFFIGAFLVLAAIVFCQWRLIKISRLKVAAIKQRLLMSPEAFIAEYGRSLEPEEVEIVLEVRGILAEAAKMAPGLVYPRDVVLDLFTAWAAEFEAIPELVMLMDKSSLFSEGQLNYEKIKNPDFHGNISVVEFIDSVIIAFTKRREKPSF